MSIVPAPVMSWPTLLGLIVSAVLCWLLQYGSVQHAAGQVAPLFQAAIAAAWAMLLLWLWTRWRGIALFAQGASLLSALWGGGLFTLQWACLYLAVDRQPLWLVAINFLLSAALFLLIPLARTRWRGVAALFLLMGGGGVLVLGVCARHAGQGAAWLLALTAALTFALGLHQTRRAQMQAQDLMRWRFYQLCVAALLLPLAAVAFSPSWNFLPGRGEMGAILLQAVCGGLAFPFLLAAALPEPGYEAAGDAHISNIVPPDA
ncbi:MAG: hypothetical protein WCA24_02980 [Thiomonas sp.]